MAAKSLPPVSAKVIADIEQYVTELRRAENVTRRFSSDVDNELTQLSKQMKSKFSLGDVGKDILKGAGLFGGFDIARTAAEQMTEYFREAAEYAKQIEESTARQLDMTLKTIAGQQTDEQRRDFLQKEVRRAEEALRIAKEKGIVTETTLGPNYEVTTRKLNRPLTEEENAAVQKASENLTTAAKALEDWNKAAEKRKSDKQVKDWADLATAVKAAGGELRSMAEIRGTVAAAGANENDATVKLTDDLVALREKYLEMGDPMRQFKRQLEDIAELQRMGVKGFGFDEALAAQIQVWAAVAEAAKKTGEVRSMAEVRGSVDTVAEFKDETKALADAARDMGFAFSSAFEDAVVGGEKARNVVASLASDIARMALRMTVTNPLLNAVFGGISGWSPLPGIKYMAEGGPVSGGSPYIVGERGPELFVPRGSGDIVPNHKLNDGEGITVIQHNSFGAGVTAQQLLPILQMQKRDIIATIAEARRRRTGTASALA